MPTDPLLTLQRQLRSRLLEGAGPAPQARALAAELLLYIDSAPDCWRLCTEWLCDALGADRVDGGFSQPGHAVYQPLAEAQRPAAQLPSVIGTSFNAQDANIRPIWAAGQPVAFPDLRQAHAIGAGTRHTLQRLGTRAKLVLPAFDGAQPVALFCADWSGTHPGWSDSTLHGVRELAHTVLGPVLRAARCWADAAVTEPSSAGPRQPAELPGLDELTPAELRLVRLIATGMSYKEAARELGRAFSTVDHQLRSIRAKLGVPTTARLVTLLASRHPL